MVLAIDMVEAVLMVVMVLDSVQVRAFEASAERKMAVELFLGLVEPVLPEPWVFFLIWKHTFDLIDQ